MTDKATTRRAFIAQTTATALGGIACADTAPNTVARVSNEAKGLLPVTAVESPALQFDLPGLRIGCATYPDGPTGCTVFRFDRDPLSVIDIRGGSAGTISGTSLEDARTTAICFAGGSVYGLEAASGVAAELFAESNYEDIKLVRGAILWDFWRKNRIYPDKQLGQAALKAARPGVFPLGRAGAGVSAGCAGEDTGQGGAFRQIGKTKIAVFTVVNAAGVIVDRQGRVVCGNRDPKTGERTHPLVQLERRIGSAEAPLPARGRNTTLTMVVTNQSIGEADARAALQQLARQVHSALGRAIQPFHTASDGDVLFAVSTEEVENRNLNAVDVGLIASELAWDAVLACLRRH
jgi:L-aminopeptidase/D-esterase-like protein